MGIRVTCPNGHVLNVKSHQAGRKGRCPVCGAAFVVPQASPEDESDSDAPKTAFDQIDIEQLTRESREAQSTAAAPQRPSRSLEESVSIAIADTPMAPGPSVDRNQPPAEITDDPSAVWYVRRASGEQYGPAQGQMFWQWVQEGRVPEDSHVWKQGWPEWKSAKEWLARKAPAPRQASPAPAPAPRPAPAASPSLSPVRPGGTLSGASPAAAGVLPTPASPIAAAAARNIRRRKSNDTTAAIVIVLLLLLLASLTGAIIVVYRSVT